MQTRSFFKMRQEKLKRSLKQDIENMQREGPEPFDALQSKEDAKIINDTSYAVIEPVTPRRNSVEIDSP